MVYYVKVYLCNREVADVTVDTDSIDEWVDEVMIKGISSEDVYIPVSSIMYIKFNETSEATEIEEIEVEFEQED